MIQRICLAFLSLIFGALSPLPNLAAQSDVRATMAGLKQDMAIMDQQVRALRLEIEQMQRENTALRHRIVSIQSGETQITNISSAIDILRREYRVADESNKQAILVEVNRQIKALAEETQTAINVVASPEKIQPNIQPPVRFSEDYPKSGIKYTVLSGDTLSKIAHFHGSTIKDIQNANKIENPSLLQVNQTIFIPIAQ